ncbi:hypothetical protein MKZ79_09495 [Erwinia sp. CGal63]
MFRSCPGHAVPVIQAAKTSGGEPHPLSIAEIATLKSRLLATVHRHDDMCERLLRQSKASL